MVNWKAITSSLFTVFLAFAMLTTGTINTLSSKFQDLQSVKGLGKYPPTLFEHPFFQTAAMFIGELVCLGLFKISQLVSLISAKKSGSIQEEGEQLVKKQKPYVNSLVFLVPALCDLTGTTLLHFGLIYTYASVYQMLRGIVVVFSAILSVIFLKAKLYYHKWVGVILILAGLSVVGLSSFIYGTGTHTAKNPFLGAMFVVAAQFFGAMHYVTEEKFIGQYDVAPLQCVGWEGFWGLNFTIIFLFIAYWIPGYDHHSFENTPYAMKQVLTSPYLAGAVVTSVCSIAMFNYFGVTITKRINNTTRAAIDSCRTAMVWICSLIIRWETFRWLQLVGFIILVCGTFLYTEVIKIPYYHQWYLKRLKAWEDAEKLAKAQKEAQKEDE